MKNWVPYKLGKEGGRWKTSWVFLGERLFLEPFFENTLMICKREAAEIGKPLTFTELEELSTVAETIETVPPTAFIFHISRCGSTLFSQLLSLDEKHIVVSEAPIFDDILRLKFKGLGMDEQERLNYLRAAVRILGQKRLEAQRRYFIKWDSWHLFFLAEIRQLYPQVPFVFLTRDIPKVIASHQKQPGMQSVRGLLEPAIYRLTLDRVLAMSPTEYLEHILQEMVAVSKDFCNKDPNSLLLPYEAGALENYRKFLDFLDIQLDEAALEVVRSRLQFHSKAPKEQFISVP